jgi:hypothetical protein
MESKCSTSPLITNIATSSNQIQSFSDVEDLGRDRMYWIGSTSQFGKICVEASISSLRKICADASILSYYRAKFRKHFMRGFHSMIIENCNPVIFGGCPRRELFAKMRMDQVCATIPDGDHRPGQDIIDEAKWNVKLDAFTLPSSCFVDQHSDIDIHFASQESIDAFLRHLRTKYSVLQLKTQNTQKYNGLILNRVRLRQKVSLLPATHRPTLRLDLVIKALPDIEFLPDFDVNCLQISQPGIVDMFRGVKRGTSTRPFSSAIDRFIDSRKELDAILLHIDQRYASVLACNFQYYRCWLVSHFEAVSSLQDVYCPTEEDVFDSAQAMNSNNSKCEYPLSRLPEEHIVQLFKRYIHRVFGARLVKMLTAGWKVCNLKLNPCEDQSRGLLDLTCGCTWAGETKNVRYNFCQNDVEIACDDCRICSVLFDDFTVLDQ